MTIGQEAVVKANNKAIDFCLKKMKEYTNNDPAWWNIKQYVLHCNRFMYYDRVSDRLIRENYKLIAGEW